MKICHVNLASGFGGGEHQTIALIKHQLGQGFHPLVVANPKSPFSQAARDLGCQVVEAVHWSMGHFKASKAGFDAIHVHDGKAVYWAFIYHLVTHKPYIITRRIGEPLKNKYLRNAAYSKAKRVVGISSAVKHQVQKALPHVEVSIIPSSPITYPVNSETVQSIKHQFKDKFIVIQAGRFLQLKGFDVTIQCARMLEHQYPNIQFCLLGDGVEASRLKTESQGLTNLTFEGKQSNMGDWFAAADLLIHPSYIEGLGSVILEAIHAGLPVVGTCVGGIPDIIQNEVNGLLIQPGDSQALADSVVRLHVDEALKKHLLEQAPNTMEAFDISKCVDQYQNIYETLAR